MRNKTGERFFFFFSHFEKFIIFFGKRKLFSYHVETYKIVLSKAGLKSPKYIYIYIKEREREREVIEIKTSSPGVV